MLDDDYVNFNFRFNNEFDYCFKHIKNLDYIFSILVNFFNNSMIDCLSILQGGDFIGGSENAQFATRVRLVRKIMNLFVCSTKRPFQFYGKINEDVNCYVRNAVLGKKFFSLNQISLKQTTTQANSGGLTDIYKAFGTYVKSFYSVIIHPSGVRVSMLNTSNPRLHHSIKWNTVTPYILHENIKKT